MRIAFVILSLAFTQQLFAGGSFGGNPPIASEISEVEFKLLSVTAITEGEVELEPGIFMKPSSIDLKNREIIFEGLKGNPSLIYKASPKALDKITTTMMEFQSEQ